MKVPIIIDRYRRAVSSALWVQFIAIVCYLPLGITTALLPFVDFTPAVTLCCTVSMTLVKVYSEPYPLLLEDRRCETSGHRHNRAGSLLCMSPNQISACFSDVVLGLFQYPQVRFSYWYEFTPI